VTKITQYTYREMRKTTVVNAILEDGRKVYAAEFANDANGKFLFGCFTDGLARISNGPSLFNEVSGEYTVGTMGQLVPGLRG